MPRRTDAPRPALRAEWPTGSLVVLSCLLALVPPLLVADQLHHWGVSPFAGDRWNVDVDGSWMEILGYGEVALAATLLLAVALRRRVRVYAAWAVALTVLVLDDSLQWHETVGAWAAESLGLPAVGGLRAQDAGELTVWTGMGLTVVVVLWLTHGRSPRPARRDSWWLAVLVVVLMVFAVAVDMLHMGVPALSSTWRADHLTTWVEAAGEVAAMAGLAAFAYGVARRELGGPAWSTWPQEPQRGAHTGAGASSADIALQR